MILPLTAVWGGVPFNPLAGNAQVFDGSFDYDKVSLSGATPIDRTTPFAACIELDILTLDGATDTIFSFGGGTAIIALTLQTNRLFYIKRQPSGLRLLSGSVTLSLGKQNIIFTDNGTNTDAGLGYYINGVEIGKNLFNNTLSANPITPYATDFINIAGGVFGTDGANLLKAKIKTLEIINRIPTSTEITDTSAGGSFVSAGIAHNSGEYILAVDFDKADGQDPTTFAGTPTYTITGFGGTTYESYL